MLVRTLLSAILLASVAVVLPRAASIPLFDIVGLAQASELSAPVAQSAAAGGPNLVVTTTDLPDPINNADSVDPPLQYVMTVRNSGNAPTTADYTVASGNHFVVIHLPPGLVVDTTNVVVTDDPSVTCHRVSVGKPGDAEHSSEHIDFECHAQNPLGAGLSYGITLNVKVSQLACGTITAKAIVDPDAFQAETSEADNAWRKPSRSTASGCGFFFGGISPAFTRS